MHKHVKFWSVVCKDLEVEEDAPSSAIRKLGSYPSVPLSWAFHCQPCGRGSDREKWCVSSGFGQKNLGGKCQISRERRNIYSCKQSYKKITISLKLLKNSGVGILVEFVQTGWICKRNSWWAAKDAWLTILLGSVYFLKCCVYILFWKPKVYMLVILSGCFLLFTVVCNYTQTLTNNSSIYF